MLCGRYRIDLLKIFFMLKLCDSLFYFFVTVANVQELKNNSQKCVGINSETATINLKVGKKNLIK